MNTQRLRLDTYFLGIFSFLVYDLERPFIGKNEIILYQIKFSIFEIK